MWNVCTLDNGAINVIDPYDGPDVVPGILLNEAVTSVPAAPVVEEDVQLVIDFDLVNDLAADAIVVITVSRPDMQQSAAVTAAIGGALDGTLTVDDSQLNVDGTITLTRAGGATLTAGGATCQITLNNLVHPLTVGPLSVSLKTFLNDGVTGVDAFPAPVALTDVAAADMTNPALVLTSFTAGDAVDVVLKFEAQARIPADAKIIVTFPVNFLFDEADIGTTTVTSAAELTGGWTFSLAGDGVTATLARDGLGNVFAKGVPVTDLTINNVRNRAFSGATLASFQLVTAADELIAEQIDFAGPVLLPGEIPFLGVTLDSLQTGESGNVVFDFPIANPMPLDSTIVVTFSDGFTFDDPAATTASSVFGIDGGLVVDTAFAPNSISITRAGDGANLVRNHEVPDFTLSNIRNPSIVADLSFTLTYSDSFGGIIASGTNDTGIDLIPSPLTDVSITFEDVSGGGNGDIYIQFTIANTLPLDGKVVITFPDEFAFDHDGEATEAASPLVMTGGTFTDASANPVVVLTRAGGGSDLAPGTVVNDLIITNVRNQFFAGQTFFDIQTFRADDVLIDQSLDVLGPIIELGVLTDVVVTPVDYNAGSIGTLAVGFTLANPLAADDRIVLEFTDGYIFNPAGIASSAIIDGFLIVTVPGDSNTLVLVRAGGPTEIAAGTSVTDLTVTLVENPGFEVNVTYNVFIADNLTRPTDGGNVTATIVRGALGTPTADLSTYVLGEAVTATFTFTTANDIPDDGQVEITLPTGFDVAAASLSSAEFPGGFAAADISGAPTLVFPRVPGGGDVAPATPVTLTLSGLVNPTLPSGEPYVITTQTSLAQIIDDSGDVVGPTFTPGTLDNLAFSMADNLVGGSGDITFSFTPFNVLPVDGRIVITFDDAYSFSAPAAASAADIDGTFVVSTLAAPPRLVLTRTAAAVELTSANTVTDLVVSGVNNPGSVGIFAYTIATQTASGVDIDTGVIPGVVIAAGSLSGCSVTLTPGQLRAGGRGSITVGMTLDNDLFSDAKIVLTMPNGFSYNSPAATDVISSDISGFFTEDASGAPILVIERDGGGALELAGDVIDDLVIDNVVYPKWGLDVTFDMYTTDADDNVIDGCFGVAGETLVPGALTAASISPESGGVSVNDTFTLAFTVENPIPVDGYVEIVFPDEGFGFSPSTYAQSAAVVDGSLDVVVIDARTIHIVRGNDGTAVTGGTVVDDLVIANIINPATPLVSTLFTVRTRGRQLCHRRRRRLCRHRVPARHPGPGQHGRADAGRQRGRPHGRLCGGPLARSPVPGRCRHCRVLPGRVPV